MCLSLSWFLILIHKKQSAEFQEILFSFLSSPTSPYPFVFPLQGCNDVTSPVTQSRDKPGNNMAGDEHQVNKGKFYLRGEGMNDKSRELYERNALGNIVSHLFPGYGEFYAVPWTAKKEIFELLSVFVKNGCDTFEYVGSLRKNGGILAEETSDLLHVLKPHMHSSSKKEVNRYLTALKQPFSRRVSELFIDAFVGRPEGKIFGWIDLGTTQIEYVDPVKLTARVNKSRIDQECSQLAGKTHIYVICKVGIAIDLQ